MDVSRMKNAVLLLVFVLNVADCKSPNCDPRTLIEHWEGHQPCMYLDTKKIKTIGIGYNMEKQRAPTDFHNIGADFEKFFHGPLSASGKECNCSAVPCLTEDQINKLFGISVETAIVDAQKVIPTFSTLCCPVQNVMVDMAFTFGLSRFLPFKATFAKLIVSEYWKAAGDDLTVSKWCVKDSPRRCLSDAAIVAKGCGCNGRYPQACDSTASSCCGSTAQQTCCKGSLTFSSKYATKTFDELLCCPEPHASCCSHNRCCKAQTPICCPRPPAEPTYCCPAGYPICKNGSCYREDGAVSKGEQVVFP